MLFPFEEDVILVKRVVSTLKPVQHGQFSFNVTNFVTLVPVLMYYSKLTYYLT